MDQLSPVQLRSADTAPAVLPAGRTRRTIVAGLLVATGMVALLAASQLVDYGVFDLRIGALNTDSHESVFGVASLLAEATAAAAIWWRGRKMDRHRWAWFLLAGIVAGLVVLRTLVTYNPKAVAVPLALMFLLLCWLTWRDSALARTVVWGALILMMTSLLLHEVGLDADVLNYSDQSWSYQITAVLKHGTELAGWILLVTGITAGIADRRVLRDTGGGIASLSHAIRRGGNGASARGPLRRAGL
jgi:hypothetical protein